MKLVSLLWFFVLLGMTLLFQNCGGGDFQSLTATTQDSSSVLLQSKIRNRSSFFPHEGNFDIIVVAGQSNAAGTGLGQFSVDKSLDHRIFQIGRHGQDADQVIPASDSLQNWWYFSNSPYVGFSMSFAREYVKNLPPDRKVLIVPAAYGGTRASEWQPNGFVYNPANGEKYKIFEDLLRKTNVALSKPGSRIVAFLWHQGEGDSGNDISRDEYARQLKVIFNTFRNTYKTQGSIPILLGELVPSWMASSPSGKIKVHAAMHLVSQEIGRSAVISTQGLRSNFEEFGLNPDGTLDDIHFSAASQVILGKRYHQKYFEINKKSGESCERLLYPPAITAAKVEKVQYIYCLVVKRESDDPGLQTWINSSLSIPDIFRAFISSREMSQKFYGGISYDVVAAEIFVESLYAHILNRKSDPSGKALWVEKIKRGQTTRDRLITDFLNSEEFRRKFGGLAP